MSPSAAKSVSLSPSSLSDKAKVAMMSDQELYDLLGVPHDADKLIMEWSYNKPDQDNKNKKISATYEVLRNPSQRRYYTSHEEYKAAPGEKKGMLAQQFSAIKLAGFGFALGFSGGIGSHLACSAFRAGKAFIYSDALEPVLVCSIFGLMGVGIGFAFTAACDEMEANKKKENNSKKEK